MTEYNFTEEWVRVGDIEIDHKVQRTHLDQRKIERILANYNPAALGVVTLSRRNNVTIVAIDGMHRVRVVNEKFGPDEMILAHVFSKLTIAEEAQMFLDLNAGNQPSLLDKYKVRLEAGDPIALGINEIVYPYGWSIAAGERKGVIQAVGALERVYRKSLKIEAEPNLLHLAILCISNAWGDDPIGVQAPITEGLGAFFEEYSSLINLDVIQRKMKTYKGGPSGLITDAQQMAAIRRGKISMGVAERLTDEYNKGRQRRTLHAWRRRA